jgi:hypothetical protein
MQNVIPRLSRRRATFSYAGAEIGRHNHEIYVNELGLSSERLDELTRAGVI